MSRKYSKLVHNDRVSGRHGSVVIVNPSVGAGHEREQLMEFLIHNLKVRKVILVTHPLPGSVHRYSVVFLRERDKLQITHKVPRFKENFLLSWIIDVVLTLYIILRYCKKIDIYFGVTSWFYFLPGLLLRAVKLIKNGVFWTTDYFPRRFQNRILNRVYHVFDDLCVRHADFVWCASSLMIKARLMGGCHLSMDKQIVVPYGIKTTEIMDTPLETLLPDSIVYLGALHGPTGFELLLEALPTIIRKRPNVRVTVISYELLEEWNKIIKELKLEDNFEIMGYISDRRELRKVISKRKIGLALYAPSFKSYSDPARPKDLMACGLPVIITNVPLIARDIKEHRAGIVINYDKDELIAALMKLLEDEEFYKERRQNAIKLVSHYDINVFFKRAFDQMEARA